MEKNLPAIERLESACKKHGLRLTPQRIAIFSALGTTPAHPSAQQVYKEVRKKMPHVSFDTVNRAMLTFAELGLIEIMEGLEGVRLFDTCVVAHDHFHCRSCGRVIDFTAPIREVALPPEIRKCRVDGMRIAVFGLCETCAATQGSKTGSSKKEEGV